jgi:S-adenosylmethionine:tRNA ribosyltransferase-isomerase
MAKKDDLLTQYDYPFPPSAIALEPAQPRDAAKLLVVNRKTGKTSEDTFRNLALHLPPKSIIVLNDTKVLPARIWLKKKTGGKVQVFYLHHDRSYWHALCDRPLNEGEIISGHGFFLTVHNREGKVWALKPSFPLTESLDILQKYGTTPIPPYIKHSPLSERRLRKEYQTVWAKVSGSVAAPTASLHFTPRLLKALKRQGHTIQFVTLHVGLGTFSPVTESQLSSGRLHEEYYRISLGTSRVLARAKEEGRAVVAVGTTVARTLESATDSRGRLRRLSGKTDLFITPGYRWRFIDALITNFHVPQSSLMMLVASFIDSRQTLLRIYRWAIKKEFRLFSFGDGMLIR